MSESMPELMPEPMSEPVSKRISEPISEPAPKADILVIDDKPENLNLLSSLLIEQGYKIRSVTKGSTGIRGAQVMPPDLILLDINMPQMSGYEVCQQLKADDRTREIPIIFISALEAVNDKEIFASVVYDEGLSGVLAQL